jgi:hypothetical protein
MGTPTDKPAPAIASDAEQPRVIPEFSTDEDGVVQVNCSEPDTLERLYGVKTQDAASGLMKSALNALGRTGEHYRPFIAAMTAELEPRDAIEAMLVTQMAATHVAMTAMAQKMADQTMWTIRESTERSMTRLSRTYLAQMDALKKYRVKAQQVVRVERVTVNDGGQAIVGDVTHVGRVGEEKSDVNYPAPQRRAQMRGDGERYAQTLPQSF